MYDFGKFTVPHFHYIMGMVSVVITTKLKTVTIKQLILNLPYATHCLLASHEFGLVPSTG